MAASPALLSPQYARPSPPRPRRLLPPHLPPSTAADRLRLRVRRGPSPAQAKFGKFDAADAPTEAAPAAPATSEVDGAAGQAVLEDDSCLPPDLEGAIWQSGKASADFVNSGGMRGIAELLIPQLEFLNQEGAQAEVWALSRILLDTLAEETGQVVKAIFPDAGVAALLKHQWQDAKFKCASLSDRKPVDTDDGVVVMIIPDHQMLESVERIASQLADDPIRPLVMWNPRLVSGDVGVGYNVRNLRRNFLSTFTTVYSMRPLPTGAIFRCYPEKWKVFYDDPKRPNRYLLARESSSRPDATDIEIIFGGGGASEQPDEEPSMMNNVMAAFSSVSRFMRVISK
uniref:Predicted protein n=1 Tax=Hordeum vulgare subsp. vulgare TaxID=112509 RepID=F2CQP7_HORVV|nr:predicted protein [Hordeum vulgare subsp. vulgare]BAJ91605.1 predicted protein [Hordeum vulgare subsp. vulgare]BAK02769.1 predicted protein [Hordeum vulgare subsp. vulgare]BAK05216.1 predicted protein [Hordeum vulgare subsp. vulgare]